MIDIQIIYLNFRFLKFLAQKSIISHSLLRCSLNSSTINRFFVILHLKSQNISNYNYYCDDKQTTAILTVKSKSLVYLARFIQKGTKLSYY